jgi:hypothetical protein
MKISKVVVSLVVAVMTFFSGIAATKLLVAYEIGSYPSSVRECYFFNDKESQMPFINSYKQGKAEAQTDSEQGKLLLKVTGMPHEDEEKLFASIYRKYAIECDRIASCDVTTEIIGYQKGYNEVMKTFIEQRYGAGFLEKISSEEN